VSEAEKARAEARIGRVLNDKWTLERLLGIGGMAAVYAGLHRNGARAAVKVLHPELSHDADIRERFLREGYVANQVSHPGAVQVLDDDVVVGGPDDGTAYLVMELLEGEPVDERVFRTGKPLGEDEVLVVADDVLAVLEAAHAKNVVHRDIKPENLFLTKSADGEPRVKVLDFGFARLEAGMNTRMGVALGTPSFMSPEQASGRGDEIDGRSDLFGVGATMFRLLTNARIHDGANGPEIAGKMATLPAPAIRSIAPRLSSEIAAIIDRSLQFRKEDRYPDAASMRADVRALRKARTDAAAAARLERQSTILDQQAAPPSADKSPPPPPPPVVRGPSPISRPPPPRRAPPADVAPRREPVEAAAASERARPPLRGRSKERSREKEKKSSVLAVIALGWVVLVAAVGTVVFIVRGRLIGQHDDTGFVGDAAAGDGDPDSDLATTASTDDAPAVVPGTSNEAETGPTVEEEDAGEVESLDDVDDAGDSNDAGDADAGNEASVAPSTSTPPKPPATTKPPIKKKPIGTKKKKWK
jgi:serine/threonine protein kinase